MFKYAPLVAVAAAQEMFMYGVEPNGDYPAITTPMTFVQSMGQENFNIMMD